VKSFAPVFERAADYAWIQHVTPQVRIRLASEAIDVRESSPITIGKPNYVLMSHVNNTAMLSR
jgi:hypothetical protein